MVKINWSKTALSDLKIIHQFVSKDSILYADRLINTIVSAVDILENFPLSGRIVPEKNDEIIREVLKGNYRIFYKIQSPKQITVLRVHHSARNIK